MRRLPLLVVWALLPLSAACVSSRSDLSGDGDGVLGGARVTWSLGERRPAPTGRTGIRLEVDRASGDFQQALDAGDTVQIDDVPFNGPGALEIDLDHDVFTVGFAGGFAGRSFEVEGFVGPAVSTIDVRGQLGGVRDADRLDASGAAFGFEAAYTRWDPVSPFVALRYFVGFDDTDVVESVVTRGGLALALSDHLRLEGGWQAWTYTVDHDFPDVMRSDFDFELTGPFVRLAARL